MQKYNLIIVGAGAAGLVAAITAAKNNKKVLLIEKLSTIGTKLKATGGGRCNLSNTLSNEEFIKSFGKNGRFITTALEKFDYKDLISFFKNIGVDTHIPDGFRIFPTTHKSTTILDAFEKQIKNLNIEVLLSTKVEHIIIENNQANGVSINDKQYFANNIILSTGGLGYPQLGSSGDGHIMAKDIGHKITTMYPAMMPLYVKESWVANCTADTIAKATIKVDIKKYNKLKQTDDLIFTKDGLRGPVILDFSREITPLFDKFKEIPILVNFTKNKNEDQIIQHIKNKQSKKQNTNLLDILTTLIPKSLAIELMKLAKINIDSFFSKIDGKSKNKLIQLLSWTPLTIEGNDGFKKAMITRGGIDLKEIDPKTMQSKLINNLYFCGEIVNLDGPCGGYNLQWAFSSGYLAAISCNENK